MLPFDYPPEWRWRHYSEQYLLAAFLLGDPARYDVELPSAFVQHDPELRGLLRPLWRGSASPSTTCPPPSGSGGRDARFGGAPGRPRKRAPGAVRIIRWAAVTVAAGWSLVTAVNWLSGDFWWWGGGAPLVVFFAVPLLVVAAVPMLALRRRLPSRRERARLSLAAAALVLIAARRTLSGRTWLWVVPDLVIPPLLFLLVPAVLLPAVPLAVPHPPVDGARFATGALALGATQAGVHLGGGGGPAPPGAVKVVSWDTYCWNTDDDADRFLRLPQEVAGRRLPAPGALGLRAGRAHPTRRRRSAAAASSPATSITTPRRPPHHLPLPGGRAGGGGGGRATHPRRTGRHAALRTDLAIGGRTVSVYNVHLFDMLYLSAEPALPALPPGHPDPRRRAAERSSTALAADIGRNPTPILASGNFNTLPGMGRLRALDGLTAAQGPLHPGDPVLRRSPPVAHGLDLHLPGAGRPRLRPALAGRPVHPPPARAVHLEV